MHIDKAHNVPPFLRWCSINVPTAFDNSLSYYEALCALTKWLKDDVVSVINNNADVTEQYIKAVDNLEKYVRDYFDNLDVQEEINNKLDQMVEDGTLQEIIGSYLNANAVWGFDSVADMKDATNLVNGSYARTLGYHSKNDGGSALYKIRNITNDDVVDEKTIIEINDSENTLIAELIFEDKMRAEAFGAYGDGVTDDLASINSALLHAHHVLLGDKSYKVSGTINLTAPYDSIEGTGNSIVLSGFESDSIAIKANHCKVSNIIIDGRNTSHGLSIRGSSSAGLSDIVVDRVLIENVNEAIRTTFAWDMHFSNSRVLSSVRPIVMDSQSNNITFTSCYFSGFTSAMKFTNAEGVLFEGCDITNNNGTGSSISLYQSYLTLVNCYYERLGGDRLHISTQVSETTPSSINILGGSITQADGMNDLIVSMAKGTVNYTKMKGGQVKVVSYNYSSTSSDNPATGRPLTDITSPDSAKPNKYNSVVLFDGKYDVTFTRTNTSFAFNQTFADGEKSLQYTTTTNQGIRFAVEADKNYIVEIEGITDNADNNIYFKQGGSATYSTQAKLTGSKLYIPFKAKSTTFDIYWGHNGVIKISRLAIYEA